jgi:hypothetical protein
MRIAGTVAGAGSRTAAERQRVPALEGRRTEVRYPLAMSVCQSCWLVQLDEIPPPEALFCQRPYITGLNAPIVRHFQNLARHLAEKSSSRRTAWCSTSAPTMGRCYRCSVISG